MHVAPQLSAFTLTRPWTRNARQLHLDIVVHMPLASLACLALCSHAWSRSVTAAARTERLWCAMNEQRPRERYFYTTREAFCTAYDLWQRDWRRLFGVIFSLCDGPAAASELCGAFSELDHLSSVYVIDDHGELGKLLAQSPRAHEWTGELVCDVDARHMEPDNLEEANCVISDLRDLVSSMRAAKSSFNVDENDVYKHLLSPHVTKARSSRSLLIMEAYAHFYEEYEFDAVMGATMGSAVAAMSIPMDDLCDLIPRLVAEETDAEADGAVDTRGYVATIAFLRAMTHDSAFPTTWASADLNNFNTMVAGWSMEFRRAAAPMAIVWLDAALLSEIPKLDTFARGLLAALR